MACSTGCPSPGAHASFGACLRSKNLQIDMESLRVSSNVEKLKLSTLADYKELRETGSQPATTQPADVHRAKVLAMKNGVYRSDDNL